MRRVLIAVAGTAAAIWCLRGHRAAQPAAAEHPAAEPASDDDDRIVDAPLVAAFEDPWDPRALDPRAPHLEMDPGIDPQQVMDTAYHDALVHAAPALSACYRADHPVGPLAVLVGVTRGLDGATDARVLDAYFEPLPPTLDRCPRDVARSLELPPFDGDEPYLGMDTIVLRP